MTVDVAGAAAALHAADDILILTHRRPDGDTAGCAGALCRGLQQIGKRAYILENPEINYVKSIMMTYGAYGAQMTGSGSAVFGIFDSFEYAAVACTMLKENYPEVFIARNV